MSDPILIVGAGPTGLTAALELSRFGIPVRVIDKMPTPATTSRAIGIQARTLELMAQRGLAEEMVRLGNPASAGSVYGGGKRLTQLAFTHVDSRFDYLLFLSQAETERILREAIERHGVAIERGVELVGLSQDALSHDPSPVHATLRHHDGALEQVATPWLISAEGAHSVVRTTLDLQFEGKTLDETYALGDLHIDGDLPETDFHIFSSEHGFMGLFPMGGGRYRLIASNPLSKPAKDTEPSLDELQRIYDQRSHIPARFHDLTWSSWFRINSRMVSRLKFGRLLLGGDSAHIHSPAGAQGMNTGIQDMINLCWKLAFVVQGKAPATLLDTYEADRLPVMRDVLFKTENLTGLIGSEIPVVRSLVNHLGPWIAGLNAVQENSTARMSQVALGYRGSSLSSNHPHGSGLHAGDRVPDRAVRHRIAGAWADARLQSLLDPSRVVLLVAHGSEAGTLDPGLVEAVSGGSGIMTVVELAPPAAQADKASYEADFGLRSSVFLVRPDGYVGLAASANNAARPLAAWRGQWLSAREPAHAG
jgi:2-polyprenyl-6-methoxyphenol hydroxylase-like FAD-dependent oxidoreductase